MNEKKSNHLPPLLIQTIKML